MQQGWATSHDKNQSQRAVGRRISTMGSAATLLDVVNFDNLRFNIGLTATQMNDLAAFLQTLRRPKLDEGAVVRHLAQRSCALPGRSRAHTRRAWQSPAGAPLGGAPAAPGESGGMSLR
jgi:hypothetical protein